MHTAKICYIQCGEQLAQAGGGGKCIGTTIMDIPGGDIISKIWKQLSMASAN